MTYIHVAFIVWTGIMVAYEWFWYFMAGLFTLEQYRDNIEQREGEVIDADRWEHFQERYWDTRNIWKRLNWTGFYLLNCLVVTIISL